jgi:hypothetical protein
MSIIWVLRIITNVYYTAISLSKHEQTVATFARVHSLIRL